MKIGYAIKKLRLERGATQESIALEAGTNAGNLSRIERCQQQPSLELVEKISAALDTTVSNLYSYAEMANVTSDSPLKISNKKPSNGTIQLCRHFLSLSSKNQQLVIEFVKMLERMQSAD